MLTGGRERVRRLTARASHDACSRRASAETWLLLSCRDDTMVVPRRVGWPGTYEQDRTPEEIKLRAPTPPELSRVVAGSLP